MRFEVGRPIDMAKLEKLLRSDTQVYFSQSDVIHKSSEKKAMFNGDFDSLLDRVEEMCSERLISRGVISSIALSPSAEGKLVIAQSISVVISNGDEGCPDSYFKVNFVCTTRGEVEDYLKNKRFELRRKLLSAAEKLIPEDMR